MKRVFSSICIFFWTIGAYGMSRPRHLDDRFPLLPYLQNKKGQWEGSDKAPKFNMFMNTIQFKGEQSMRLQNGDYYRDDGETKINFGLANNSLSENLHFYTMLNFTSGLYLGLQYDLLKWNGGGFSIGSLASFPWQHDQAYGGQIIYNQDMFNAFGKTINFYSSLQYRDQFRGLMHTNCPNGGVCTWDDFENTSNEIRVREKSYDLLMGLVVGNFRFLNPDITTNFSFRLAVGHGRTFSSRTVREKFAPSNYQHKRSQNYVMFGIDIHCF